MKHFLEAEIWSSEKVDLGMSKVTCPTLLSVDELQFTGRRRNRCRSHVFPILYIFSRSRYIRDRSLKLSEVDSNFARFWPHFFKKCYANFSTLIIKLNTLPIMRPRELGGLALKRRKEIVVKRKTAGNYQHNC